MTHYREPYPDAKSRLPLRVWPCEIPIEGQPADVHEAVDGYSRWLSETDMPMMLFYAQPGGIIQKEGVAWCEKTIRNLTTVDIGRGLHFIQEDNPHLIGEELAKWLANID